MVSRRFLPRLHVVTDDAILRRPDFVEVAGGLLEVGGADVAFHVRGPHSSGRRVFEAARALVPMARQRGSLLVVNDRVDVALALDLGGVHLGRRSMPIDRVRGLAGADPLVGISVHDAGEAEKAHEDGADYVIAGMIFPSASHPERTPLGLPGLEQLVRVAAESPEPARPRRLRPSGPSRAPQPVVAIGGLTPGRVEEVLATGAHGVATVSAVWGTDRPGFAVESFLASIRDALGAAGIPGAAGPAGPTVHKHGVGGESGASDGVGAHDAAAGTP